MDHSCCSFDRLSANPCSRSISISSSERWKFQRIWLKNSANWGFTSTKRGTGTIPCSADFKSAFVQDERPSMCCSTATNMTVPRSPAGEGNAWTAAGVPVALFQSRMPPAAFTGVGHLFDITPDGQRFLANAITNDVWPADHRDHELEFSVAGVKTGRAWASLAEKPTVGAVYDRAQSPGQAIARGHRPRLQCLLNNG